MQKLLVVQWDSGQKNGGSSQRPCVQFLMNVSISLLNVCDKFVGVVQCKKY